MGEVTIIDYTMNEFAHDYFDKVHPCNSPEIACCDISLRRYQLERVKKYLMNLQHL